MVKKTMETKGKLKTDDKEKMKKEVIENKTKKEKKKNVKKLLIIIFSIILIVAIATCIIIFIIIKIPSKYCGTYVSYSYVSGEKCEEVYRISSLSVKHTSKCKINGKEYNESEKLKYEKKGKDLIVESKLGKNYLIIEDDKLYVNDKKDISLEKKYNMFFYNVKSDKRDIYEIQYEADKFEDQIEYSINSWSRDLIYKAINEEYDKDDSVYFLPSDEKSDESDLNEYSVKYKVGNAEVTVDFDRKTQKIDSVSYSAHVSMSKYSLSNIDSATAEDLYDSRAILLSVMAIISSNGKYIDSPAADNTEYHNAAIDDFADLLDNRTDGKNGEIKFNLSNKKYSISYEDSIKSGDSYVLGSVHWYIYVK